MRHSHSGTHCLTLLRAPATVVVTPESAFSQTRVMTSAARPTKSIQERLPLLTGPLQAPPSNGALQSKDLGENGMKVCGRLSETNSRLQPGAASPMVWMPLQRPRHCRRGRHRPHHGRARCWPDDPHDMRHVEGHRRGRHRRRSVVHMSMGRCAFSRSQPCSFTEREAAVGSIEAMTMRQCVVIN